MMPGLRPRSAASGHGSRAITRLAPPRVIRAGLRNNLHTFNPVRDRACHVAVSAGTVRCNPGGNTALADHMLQAGRDMYLHKRSCLH